MNGAMMSATSRLAMASAVGILLSMSSAKAADLGGNCCADLEERVAELEATTARKGNRKMSLTVNGQVSRAIMYYNDGRESKTFAGLDSRVESSRFFFTGNAKVTPRVTAGFEMMMDISIGAQTSAVSNGPGTGFANTQANSQNVDGNWGGDAILAVRTANWYLEDKELGRVSVGRINASGSVMTIDLGGIGTGATARPVLFGGGLQYRNTATGALSGLGFTQTFGHCQGCDRFEGVVWESASLHGFLLRAAWGENDVSTYSIRYAGEHAGFQFAAGIGMQSQSRAGQIDFGSLAAPVATAGAITGSAQSTRPADDWGSSLAIKHVPSGIFVQGHYAWSTYRINAGNVGDKTQSNYLIQGGVAKNWFGPGDTALYIEYGQGKDNVFESPAVLATAGTASTGTLFGLGFNQKIDAAAMEIYGGWRRYSLSTTGVAAGAAGLEDMDLVFTGARIRF